MSDAPGAMVVRTCDAPTEPELGGRVQGERCYFTFTLNFFLLFTVLASPP